MTATPRRAVPGPGGDAEVGQLALAVAVDQHVLRLVVPVYHAALVCRGQAEQRAMQHHQRGLRRGGALMPEDLAQRYPVDELHDDRGARRRFDVLVQPDHVRVIQRSQDRRLAPEQFAEFSVGQQVRPQVLDRHQGA